MREIAVLWLDDEWAEKSLGINELIGWRDSLKLVLDQAEMTCNITCRSSSEIWNDLGSKNFDLLILDYELAKDPLAHNAFHLLDRLEDQLKRVPPVIIFSRYPRRELEAAANAHSVKRIYAVFEKDVQGARDLLQCAAHLLASGPLCFVVMSDLHTGYLAETGGISQQRFLDSLYASLGSVAEDHQINGLIICGDFAWKCQKVELVETFKMLQHVQLKLGLRSHDQMFLCPGNHDIDFSDGTPSWRSFGRLVELLASKDQGFLERFVHRNSGIGKREPFHDQASLFSVVHNERFGIVVVGLNSNRPTGIGVEVTPDIDEGQWHALTLALEQYPKELIRVAVLHHPVFSSPGGVYQDEHALADQGKALQMFAQAGISLIFHGHAHFGAVHSHRLAVINGPDALGLRNGSTVMDLTTVACPSLIAEPSSAAPQRQYLLVRLDTLDPRTGTRALSVESKVFNPANCTWGNGVAIPGGYFNVGQLVPRR